MSEISFPISALVAPHAPSVSIRSGGYYMRDPRKPPRVQPTPWTLTFPSPDEQGSPVHAWAFFVGFVLFPLWWVASFWRIPRTRRVGGTDTEKAVTLDDPQVEHGECLACLSLVIALSRALRRCEVVAVAMSYHVRDLALYLHPVHRVGGCLRPARMTLWNRDTYPSVSLVLPRPLLPCRWSPSLSFLRVLMSRRHSFPLPFFSNAEHSWFTVGALQSDIRPRTSSIHLHPRTCCAVDIKYIHVTSQLIPVVQCPRWRSVIFDVKISFDTDAFAGVVEHKLIRVVVPVTLTILVVFLVLRVDDGFDLHIFAVICAITCAVDCGSFVKRRSNSVQNVVHPVPKPIFKLLYNLGMRSHEFVVQSRMVTHHVELDRFRRSQVHNLEFLCLGEIPLGEITGQLGDALRTLGRSWLEVCRQELDGL